MNSILKTIEMLLGDISISIQEENDAIEEMKMMEKQREEAERAEEIRRNLMKSRIMRIIRGDMDHS